jgi:Protein of unknown function (DUF3810)
LKLLKKAPMQIFLLFFVSFLLLWISRISTPFANWYAGNVYPLLLNTIGRFFSIFPFSVVEIGLYCFILFLVVIIIICIIRILKKQNIIRSLLSFTYTLLRVVGILFFLFVINCGINYSRTPFSEESHLTTGEYTLEQLEALCISLTEELNYQSEQVERDAAGLAVINCDIFVGSVEAMESLGEQYEVLTGFYARPKPVWNSLLLSYQQITGIYSPFTIEANYNRDMIAYNIPFTICHELSHLRGFMREDEANYIAYLACMESDEAIFNYSGTLLAWVYSTNELYAADHEAFETIKAELVQAVKADLSANTLFWNRYEGRISEFSETVNDLYLKSNNQPEGIKSYNRMVSLLIANALQN